MMNTMRSLRVENLTVDRVKSLTLKARPIQVAAGSDHKQIVTVEKERLSYTGPDSSFKGTAFVAKTPLFGHWWFHSPERLVNFLRTL